MIQTIKMECLDQLWSSADPQRKHSVERETHSWCGCALPNMRPELGQIRLAHMNLQENGGGGNIYK
jgi:hypothetical protein